MNTLHVLDVPIMIQLLMVVRRVITTLMQRFSRLALVNTIHVLDVQMHQHVTMMKVLL